MPDPVDNLVEVISVLRWQMLECLPTQTYLPNNQSAFHLYQRSDPSQLPQTVACNHQLGCQTGQSLQKTMYQLQKLAPSSSGYQSRKTRSTCQPRRLHSHPQHNNRIKCRQPFRYRYHHEPQ
ncbi:uncharacterized protein DS421_8g231370 [Arachis hypogaea]|nr:uncharacterized protein DS421_8g231370 [Arachis hypogaea]